MKNRNLIQLINNSNGESELVKFLFFSWHNKLLFTICFVAIFSFSFWYFSSHTYYSAEARFSTNSLKQEILQRSGLNVEMNENANRVISNFFSDRVIDAIRKKFYGTPNEKMDTLDVARLKSTIGKNIVIKTIQFDNYELTVKAQDRFRCADIANELVSQVQQISNEEEQQLLQQRIELINRLARSGNQKIFTSDVEKLAATISEEFKKLNTEDRASPLLQKLQSQISYISDSLKSESNALNKVRLANEVILQVVNENNLPGITFLQRALPDYHDYNFENAGYSLLIAMALVTLLPLLIYVFQKYAYDWKEIETADTGITPPEPARVASES